MTDFTSLNETTQLGTDKIATSPAALALYRNLLAAFEGAAGAPKLLEPAARSSSVGMVKLTSGTVSGAAQGDIVMTAYTAYKHKRLFLYNVDPATAGALLYLRTSTDGGSNFQSGTGYKWAASVCDGSTTPADNGSAGGNVGEIRLSGDTGLGTTEATEAGAWEIDMFHTTTGTHACKFLYRGTWIQNGGGVQSIAGGGQRDAAQDIDAIRILMSSGNISFDYELWGVQ